MSIQFKHETATQLYRAGVSKKSILRIAEVLEGNECSIYEDYVVVDGYIFPIDQSLWVYWDKFDFLKTQTWTYAVAYADGSGTTGEKSAGAGIFLASSCGSKLFLPFNVGNGTNNHAELYAVLIALLKVNSTQANLTIYSDSEYAIGSATKDWEPKVNQPLIRLIKNNLKIRGKVNFQHVYGHLGTAGNEIADLLAKIGRRYL